MLFVELDTLRFGVVSPIAVFGEDKGIMEDAAANHDAVEAVLFGQSPALFAAFDVAITHDQSIWRKAVAQFANLADEVPVRRHLAHLFAGAAMDDQHVQIALQQKLNPAKIYFIKTDAR